MSADLLTATATCKAGEKPTAEADLENVSVLGKPVTATSPAPGAADSHQGRQNPTTHVFQ